MTKKIETPEEREAREVIEGIADNLSELSKAVKSILGGRLKRKTILVLLAHSTKMTQEKVNAVLTALENLDREYLSK